MKTKEAERNSGKPRRNIHTKENMGEYQLIRYRKKKKSLSKKNPTKSPVYPKI